MVMKYWCCWVQQNGGVDFWVVRLLMIPPQSACDERKAHAMLSTANCGMEKVKK
jgi:hypothetical protein